MPFKEPVSDSDYREQRQRIRRCCGTACLTEALIATGASSANHLESLIAGRPPKRDSDGQPMWSGLCRRWRDGVALPSNASIAHIDKLSGGRAKIAFWRDHPLWLLLREPAEWNAEVLSHVWAWVEEPARRLIFVAGGKLPRRPVTVEIGDQDVLALRSQKSLDALVTLLTLARIAELSNTDARHAVLTVSAFSILGNVVSENPHLERAKDDLFEALRVAFWSCWYLHGIRQELPKRAFDEHLARLAEDSDAECGVCVGSLAWDERPKGGRIVDQFCAVVGL